MSDLKWEAPPQRTYGNGPGHTAGTMATFVKALQERPGEWAIYPTSRIASSGTRLRHRYGCEVRTVGPAGDCTIYARWVETS